MATILVIEASARVSRSLTRALAQDFKTEWVMARPQDHFIHRDVGVNPPPFISEAWIAACFTPASERKKADEAVLKYSDDSIAELQQADIIVIATPMYNYGMPAALKAWFDQVIRIDHTFSFSLERGDWPLEPILADKQLLILSSHGEFGFSRGGIRESWNHLDTHIRTLAQFIGAKQIHQASIEYQEFGDERFADSIANSKKTVKELVAKLVHNMISPTR